MAASDVADTGEQDGIVPLRDSLDFRDRLKEAGIAVELVSAKGVGHSFDLDPASREVTRGVVPWLSRFVE